jgi:hypothetical protein
MLSWGLISVFLSQELNQRCVLILIRSHTVYQKILDTPIRKGEVPITSKSFARLRIKTIIIGLKKILPNFKSLLNNVMRAMRVHSITCDVEIGFPSASTTGIVCGYYWAIKSILTPFRQI